MVFADFLDNKEATQVRKMQTEGQRGKFVSKKPEKFDVFWLQPHLLTSPSLKAIISSPMKFNSPN